MIPMTDWQEVKLEDVCIKITDGSHWSPKTQEVGLPMASVKDMTESDIDLSSCRKISKADFDTLVKNDCKPKIDDVLIAKDGSYLKQIFDIKKEKEVVILSSIAIIRPNKEKIIPSFLKYTFKNPVFQEDVKNHYVSGAVIPRIVLKDFRKISFSLPPLDVQRKIAGILGALDDKIEVLRAQNKTLEKMAQAVFQSWFVDFDIVRAKAAGLPAADICKKYHITPDIYDLFPSAFSADNLPQGWTIGKIKNLCFDIQSGGTPQRNIKEYWCPPTIPWLSSGEVNFPIIIHTKEKISEEGLRNSSAKIWKKYTTVVAMYGATAGETTLLGIDVSANQACCALIPYKYTIYYVYLLAKANKNIYALAANGAAQQNLNKTKVSELEVIIPDAIILTCFQNLISSFFEKIIENSKQIRTLEQTRDTLLPQLISGNIEV